MYVLSIVIRTPFMLAIEKIQLLRLWLLKKINFIIRPLKKCFQWLPYRGILMEQKKILRTSMLTKLSQMHDSSFKNWSKQIAESVFNMEMWKESNIIGITISQKQEVDTKSIIVEAWKDGKTVVVPRCIVKNHNLDFRIITSFEDVKEGYAKIKEPIEERTSSVNPNDIQMLFVPGVVFDEQGYRIGYGGGYYDRFLDNYHNDTVSLAFDFQILSTIPTCSFDKPVDMIITNRRKITCHAR